MIMRRISTRTLIVFLLLNFASSNGNAAERGGLDRDEIASKAAALDSLGNDEPLCGIYAASRALDLVGVQRDPSDFATLEFISSPQGSSPSDLMALFESNGVPATPFSNLSKIDLLAHGSPIVANVRSSPFSENYDHWVCAIFDGQSLVVFDGNASGISTTIGEFLAIWNGYGLVVGPSPTMVKMRVWSYRLFALLLILGPVLALTAISFRSIRRGRQSQWIPVWLLVMINTGFVVVTSQLLFGDISNHFRGINTAILPHHNPPWRTIDLEGLRGIAGNPSALLLDARFRDDFQTGSLDGAISVPFCTSQADLANVFSNVARDTQIVVFCQSSTCPFSEKLAEKLYLLGFKDVVVPTVGISEWEESYPLGEFLKALEQTYEAKRG